MNLDADCAKYKNFNEASSALQDITSSLETLDNIISVGELKTLLSSWTQSVNSMISHVNGEKEKVAVCAGQ